MTLTLRTLLLFSLFFSLSSATTTSNSTLPYVQQSEEYSVNTSASSAKQLHRLNFLQRVMLKLSNKKHKTVSTETADKRASTSLILGVAAVVCVVGGLALFPLLAASIPLSIAAIFTGKSAINNNTTQVKKAKTGKLLGILSLVSLAVLVVLVAVAIGNAFGG